MSKGLELIFDGNRGQYIPQHFATELNISRIQGIDSEDIETLKKGPEDNEYYWDVWDRVLNNAFHVDSQGNTWRFYQDMDLWMYCDELMTTKEKKEFFGDDYENEED